MRTLSIFMLSVSFFARNGVLIFFLWNVGNIFMLTTFSFYEMRATFSCCLYWVLNEMLSAFSFYEMRTTFLGCPYFQEVICINIWKINVVRIFFWWNADNILSCPHVVRLSVVVRILSIPLTRVIQCTYLQWWQFFFWNMILRSWHNNFSMILLRVRHFRHFWNSSWEQFW